MGQNQTKTKPEPLLYGPQSSKTQTCTPAKITKRRKRRSAPVPGEPPPQTATQPLAPRSRAVEPSPAPTGIPAASDRPAPPILRRSATGPPVPSYARCILVESKMSDQYQVPYYGDKHQEDSARGKSGTNRSGSGPSSSTKTKPGIRNTAFEDVFAQTMQMQDWERQYQQRQPQPRPPQPPTDRRMKRYAGNWGCLPTASADEHRVKRKPVPVDPQPEAGPSRYGTSPHNSDDTHRGTVGAVTRYSRQLEAAARIKDPPGPSTPSASPSKMSKQNKRSSAQAQMSEAIGDTAFSSILSDSSTKIWKPMQTIRGFDLTDKQDFRPLPEAVTTPTGQLPQSETAYFSATASLERESPSRSMQYDHTLTDGEEEESRQTQASKDKQREASGQSDTLPVGHGTASLGRGSRRSSASSFNFGSEALKAVPELPPSLSLGMQECFMNSSSSVDQEVSSMINILPDDWLFALTGHQELKDLHTSQVADKSQPLHLQEPARSVVSSEQASIRQQEPRTGSSTDTLVPAPRYGPSSPLQASYDWRLESTRAHSLSLTPELSGSRAGAKINNVVNALFDHSALSASYRPDATSAENSELSGLPMKSFTTDVEQDTPATPERHSAGLERLKISDIPSANTSQLASPNGLLPAAELSRNVKATPSNEAIAERQDMSPQVGETKDSSLRDSQLMAQLAVSWGNEPRSHFSSTTNASASGVIDDENDSKSSRFSQDTSSESEATGGSSADCSSEGSDGVKWTRGPKDPIMRTKSQVNFRGGDKPRSIVRSKTKSTPASRPDTKSATRMPHNRRPQPPHAVQGRPRARSKPKAIEGSDKVKSKSKDRMRDTVKPEPHKTQKQPGRQEQQGDEEHQEVQPYDMLEPAKKSVVSGERT